MPCFPGTPCLQLRRTAELFWVCCGFTAPWNLSSRQQWRPLVGLTLLVSHFSGINIFCCLISEVLRVIFSNTLSSFFTCFKWEGKSGPSYSIFTGMQFTFKNVICRWMSYYVINVNMNFIGWWRFSRLPLCYSLYLQGKVIGNMVFLRIVTENM